MGWNDRQPGIRNERQPPADRDDSTQMLHAVCYHRPLSCLTHVTSHAERKKIRNFRMFRNFRNMIRIAEISDANFHQQSTLDKKFRRIWKVLPQLRRNSREYRQYLQNSQNIRGEKKRIFHLFANFRIFCGRIVDGIATILQLFARILRIISLSSEIRAHLYSCANFH